MIDRRGFLKGAAGIACSTIAALSPGLSFAKAIIGDLPPASSLPDLARPQGPEHDSWVTIDPAVFLNNIETMRQDVGPDVKLCVVMKADAYGHGVENLLREAIVARPAYIALVENRELRRAVRCMERIGQSAPLLRIAPATAYEAGEAALRGWSVEEVVGSLPQARMLSRVARWAGKKRQETCVIPIHINIDTGMGRMGFIRVEDAKKAMTLPGLKVKGVMTHFANAYDLKHGEELTREQMRKFDRALAQLSLSDDIIVHTANSGAALRFPWTRRDMVRVGGAFYGDIPPEINPAQKYRRAMTSFASQVIWVMENVPPNTPVGYDSVFRTPTGRKSTLATVKVGYNNGLPNAAYKQGTCVLIRGRRFPIVGITSMNLVVIDVSTQNAADPVRLGDEVVFWGRQGSDEITIDKMAETTGLTTCDLLLEIGRANPRVMTGGGPASCFSACSPP